MKSWANVDRSVAADAAVAAEPAPSPNMSLRRVGKSIPIAGAVTSRVIGGDPVKPPPTIAVGSDQPDPSNAPMVCDIVSHAAIGPTGSLVRSRVPSWGTPV